jgi:hypothetical protein
MGPTANGGEQPAWIKEVLEIAPSAGKKVNRSCSS